MEPGEALVPGTKNTEIALFRPTGTVNPCLARSTALFALVLVAGSGACQVPKNHGHCAKSRVARVSKAVAMATLPDCPPPGSVMGCFRHPSRVVPLGHGGTVRGFAHDLVFQTEASA